MAKIIIRRRFFYLFFFSLFLLIGYLNHEMWYDEVQAWLVVVDSSSYHQLLLKLKTEGHPPLWYTLLFVLNNLYPSVFIVQILHYFLSIALIYLILYKSSFDKYEKVLLSFNYYLLFEYGIISRSYILGVLAFFYLCYLYPQQTKKPIQYFLCLVVMSLSNVYSLMIASIFFLDFAYELRKKEKSHSFIIVTTIFTALVASILIAIENNHFEWFNLFLNFNLLEDTVSQITYAYFPIPELKFAFWNSNPFANLLHFTAAYGLILFSTISFFLFRISKRVFSLYFVTTLLIFLVSYFRFLGQIRHFGHLFIIFIGVIWILRSITKLPNYANFFIKALLIIQAVIGLGAFAFDIEKDFSKTKKVAAYIERYYPEHEIIVDIDEAAAPIGAYLNKPLFFLRSMDFRRAVTYDYKLIKPPEEIHRAHYRKIEIGIHPEAVYRAVNLVSQQTKNFIVVTNYEMNTDEVSRNNLLLKRHFSNAIVPMEEFRVYLFQTEKMTKGLPANP